MKFPSLQQLWESFLGVCIRFSLPILYALFATAASLALSYHVDDATEHLLLKFIYLGNFGLVLSLAIGLYAETHATSTAKKTVAHLLVVAILACIFLGFQPKIYQADAFVLIVLGFAFHLSVSFAAFSSKQEEIGFWQINKIFFLRFATSALYSVVLFAGLSIALLSMNTLFNIHWDGSIYLRLWIIIVGIFNTVFFLAGIPKPLSQLNEVLSYPKALKVFTQYVLIPLATIYLLILLAYEVKIIAEWTLPSSSVAILILGYAVFGMLSILLVHPIREEKENKWIKLYSKSFYLLMVPLLLLLAVAIVKRISDYGITESRYLLVALSVWLTFITLYFLLKGRAQIKLVPISLFTVAILTTVGPWSIKAVALRSQSNRLENYLAQKRSIKRDDEIRSLVNYLNASYGSKSLQPFVKMDLAAIAAQTQAKQKNLLRWELEKTITDTVLSSLKVSKLPSILDDQQRNYQNNEYGILPVEGAALVIEVNSLMDNTENSMRSFSANGESFSITIDSINNVVLKDAQDETFTFRVTDLLQSLQVQKFDLDQHTHTLRSVPNKSLILEHSNKKYRFRFRIETLNAYYPSTAPHLPNNIYYTGYLIIYPNL